MSSQIRWLAGPLLLILSSAQVYADAAPCFLGWMSRRPRPWDPPPEGPEHDFTIIGDPDIKQPELRIPRRLLVADASAGVSTRHAMAGLAISLGVVAGGLWCLRYRPREIPKKKLAFAGAAALLLIALLTMTGFVEAKQRPIVYPPVLLMDGIEVTVRVVDHGDAVDLSLPPDLAKKLHSQQ